MFHKSRILLTCPLILAACAMVHAEDGKRLDCSENKTSKVEISKAYLDENKNVHLVLKNGQDHQITQSETAVAVELASDRRTVAWILRVPAQADHPSSEKLFVYREGKAASAECMPEFRGLSFFKNGNYISFDCRVMYHVGELPVYQGYVWKVLDFFDEAEQTGKAMCFKIDK